MITSIKLKRRKYDVTDDQYLVSFSNHRSIVVILDAMRFRTLAFHGFDWNPYILAELAAEQAKRKKWKKIFLVCDPLWSESGVVLGMNANNVRRSYSVATPNVVICSLHED
jgi:hypothetical protein